MAILGRSHLRRKWTDTKVYFLGPKANCRKPLLSAHTRSRPSTGNLPLCLNEIQHCIKEDNNPDLYNTTMTMANISINYEICNEAGKNVTPYSEKKN